MTDTSASHIDTTDSAAVDMAYQRAQPYIAAALSVETRRAYDTRWQAWREWCRWHHTPAVPATSTAVAAYLSDCARAGKSLATVRLNLAAIQYGHRQHGHICDRKDAKIASVMAGIERTIAKPVVRARPLELEDLRRLVGSIEGEDARACRDRLLLVVGFFGALRRSEIASLDLSGRSLVTATDQGLLLQLTSTKANRATEAVALPRRDDELCPLAAFALYLAVSGIVDGSLFRAISRSGRVLDRRLDPASVAHILESRLAAVDDLAGRSFSPHSLRAGFATSAAKRGAPEVQIQRVTRHKSVEVLRGYVQFAGAFTHSASSWL